MRVDAPRACATSAATPRAEVALGAGARRSCTGRNGAGKTNLLEALYFGCTGALVPDRRTSARSCASAPARHAWRSTRDDERRRPRARASGSSPASRSACASTARRSSGCSTRRRARWSASSCPTASSSSRARRRCAARTSTRSSRRCGRRARRPRRAYAQALAQRNALLARIRAGRAAADALDAWDAELARHGLALMADRAAAVELLARRASPARAAELGLAGDGASCATGRGRGADAPRSSPPSSPSARDADLERGLHRPRPAPRRPRAAARRPRAARLRLAGPAAPRRCWRCCWPSARRWPPSAARRR